MVAPLYSNYDTPREPSKGKNAHNGLWFERFFNEYTSDWIVGDQAKKDWINKVAGSCGDKDQLETYTQNQKQLCDNLNGKTIILKSDWHFLTGMGIDHPVENGMSWHPTLGTPYISGAAVKGLVRAWIEQWEGLEDIEIQEKCLKWFGSRSKDPEQQDDNTTGSLIFFDATPDAPAILTCDIMTPHMGDWYAKGGDIIKDNYDTTLPADWHNPIPIPFLVVKQISLQFCIAVRPGCDITPRELEEVIEILNMSLEFLGAGAKTATGYGRFYDEAQQQQDQKEKQKAQDMADAELASGVYLKKNLRNQSFFLEKSRQNIAVATSQDQKDIVTNALSTDQLKELGKGTGIKIDAYIKNKNLVGIKLIW